MKITLKIRLFADLLLSYCPSRY